MKKASKAIDFLKICGLFFIIFLSAYHSVSSSFVTHDDFNFFIAGNIEFISKYYDSLGRLGAASLMRTMEQLDMPSFAHLFYKIRLPLLLLIALTATLTVLFFDRLNVERKLSIPFCCALYLLPQTGAQLIWLQTSPGLVATSFGIVAALVFFSNLDQFFLKIFLASVALVCSLLIYPSSSFVFITMVTIAFVCSYYEHGRFRPDLAISVSLFIALFCLLYVFIRFYWQPHLVNADLFVNPFNPSNTFEINFNIVQKFEYVRTDLMPRILGFFVINPSLDGNVILNGPQKVFTIACLFTLCGSIAFLAVGLYKEGGVRVLLIGFSVIAILLGISSIPAIVPSAPYPIYRILLPTTGILLFLIVFVTWLIAKRSKLANDIHLAFWIAVPLLITQKTIHQHTQELSFEYAYVKSALYSHILKTGALPAEVYFVYEPWTEREVSYSGARTAEEYNWIGQAEYIYGAINSVFGEITGKETQLTHRNCPLFKYQSCINYATEGAQDADTTLIRAYHSPEMPTDVAKNAVVINMRNAMPLPPEIKNRLKFQQPKIKSYDDRHLPVDLLLDDTLITVAADVDSSGHGLERAFDGQTTPDSFWESYWDGERPAKLTVITKDTIEQMKILRGEENAKLPSQILCRVKTNSRSDKEACGRWTKSSGRRTIEMQVTGTETKQEKTYEFYFTPEVAGSMRVYEIVFTFRNSHRE